MIHRGITMRRLVSLLTIGLFLAACGSGGATASAPASMPARTYGVATGSDQLVLRIASGGGLVPPQYTMTQTPLFALYGDGLIVVKGPVDSKFPGPLLPNLRQMRVTPVEIQRIIAFADAAGLLGPNARFDATNIFDAGTTTFTATVDGQTHTIGAYALGYEVTVADAVLAEARKKLSGFQDKLGDLATFLNREISDAAAYDAAATRLFPSPVDASGQGDQTRQTLAWPLSVDPGTSGEATKVPKTRCLVVTGSEQASFLTIAKTANSQTLWSFGANSYSVLVRPLYPDESGCPAA
jgi:hypothetical protein